MAVPVGELHRAQGFRTRERCSDMLPRASETVLAEYLVECISALFEEVLVVGLFYDREAS